jgi:hypothetical protein
MNAYAQRSISRTQEDNDGLVDECNMSLINATPDPSKMQLVPIKKAS